MAQSRWGAILVSPVSHTADLKYRTAMATAKIGIYSVSLPPQCEIPNYDWESPVTPIAGRAVRQLRQYLTLPAEP